MQRFLATHALPAGEDAMSGLQRLAEEAHQVGLRAVETFFDPQHRRAFTLFEAPTDRSVLDVYARAGLSASEVFPAERVHTDLLDEPRRAR